MPTPEDQSRLVRESPATADRAPDVEHGSAGDGSTDARPVTFDVIIPVYNHVDEVRTCIESVLAQTYPPSRILVVDNHPQPVLRADGLHPKVEILHQPVPGSYAARNLGIAHSDASHLAFIDADCIPGEGWLEAAARYLAENPEARILGGPVKVFAGSERPNWVEAFDMAMPFNPDRPSLHAEVPSGTGNLIVDATVFAEVGPYRADLLSGGDVDWRLRAASQAILTDFVPGQLVRHPARRRLLPLCRQRMRYVAGHKRLQEIHGSAFVRSPGVWRQLAPPVRKLKAFLDGSWTKDFSVGYRVRISAVYLVVYYCQGFYRLYRATGLGRDPR